jgi:hypothetical protein
MVPPGFPVLLRFCHSDLVDPLIRAKAEQVSAREAPVKSSSKAGYCEFFNSSTCKYLLKAMTVLPKNWIRHGSLNRLEQDGIN